MKHTVWEHIDKRATGVRILGKRKAWTRSSGWTSKHQAGPGSFGAPAMLSVNTCAMVAGVLTDNMRGGRE